MRRAALLFFFAFVALVVLFGGCSRTDLRADLGAIDAGVGEGGDGGPPPKACKTAADCDDRNACTTDRCTNGFCKQTPRDDDNDGVAATNCGGKDCADNDPSRKPGARENCANGVDDDCNGQVDCADQACKGQPGCVCGPREICGNEADDDCNGLRDCADPVCQKGPGCNCSGAEICGNDVDDDCNGFTDCDDSACDGTPACGCNRAEICDNGRDENCDGLIDCDDPQCANQAACTCQATTEDCENFVDDDCDGLVDCVDPNCTGIGSCACPGGPQPEACANGVDDDCDGLRDCEDPECINSAACKTCSPEVCNDGQDNDCDGKIDCVDDACVFAANCATKPEVCNNDIDDDRDGKVDCADTDCTTNPLCVTQHKTCTTPLDVSASGTFSGNTTGFVGAQSGSCGGAAGEAIFRLKITQPSKVVLDTIGSAFDTTLYLRTGACKAGRELACDDDSGGSRASKLEIPVLYPGVYYVFVDGFTIDPTLGPDEGNYVLHVSITQNPAEVCKNGERDDDGDHFADCADPGCAGTPPCSTCRGGQPGQAEMGVGKCTDGIDNDCDGKTDCDDPDCHATDSTECCNGVDDNANGIVDDFACRCASDAQCSNGQSCYTHTIFMCGPGCTNFVGDVCPFVAPGSACSASTDECEFP
jgi:hypothetical protein